MKLRVTIARPFEAAISGCSWACARLFGPGVFLCLILASTAAGQKQIRCPTGEVRAEIDVKVLSLKYSGYEMVSTLGPLSFMGARLNVAPKTLQTAAAATQVWNEYLKGLAAGWNGCVITKEQYAEALQGLHPGLKQDAASIEEIRQELAANRRVDEKRLAVLLDSYLVKLKRFAEISGSDGERLFEQMVAVASEVRGARDDIGAARKESREGFQDLSTKLDEIKKAIESVPKPSEVRTKVSARKAKMLARADEAEAAYDRGV